MDDAVESEGCVCEYTMVKDKKENRGKTRKRRVEEEEKEKEEKKKEENMSFLYFSSPSFTTKQRKMLTKIMWDGENKSKDIER